MFPQSKACSWADCRNPVCSKAERRSLQQPIPKELLICWCFIAQTAMALQAPEQAPRNFMHLGLLATNELGNNRNQSLYGSKLMSLLETQQDHLSVDIFRAWIHLFPLIYWQLQKLPRRDQFMKSDSFPEGKRLNCSLEMD